MKTARRKARRKAGASRRRKPHRSKVRCLTRTEARRLAAAHVQKRLFSGATVRDGAEVRLNIYPRGRWTAQDVWVVYPNAERWALQSSQVVVVCKRTDRVLYEGSAGDEG
jgi:hypothetical protein